MRKCLLLIILVLSFCLVGCGEIENVGESTGEDDLSAQITDDTNVQENISITCISWTDFVRWNDISYTRDYQTESISESYIGERIGRVTKIAPLTVTGSAIGIEENGMAANLPLGTEFFEIIGYDIENYIAVSTEEGYFIYKTNGSSSIVIQDTNEELIEFYAQVVKDLYDTDKGLNSDITIIAFDLTNVSNLSEEEKANLVDLLGNYFEKEAFMSTYDQLVEDGFIDDKGLFFENGLLITIEVISEEADSFLFNATKWRGGDGAYGFVDCLAKKIDGVWSYTIGGGWIS